jgi:hypothetical protein
MPLLFGPPTRRPAMTLNAWQERLDSHFDQLRERRLSLQGTHAVLYALEHGLTEDEVEQLKQDIHEWLKNSGPARRHFLAWSVYSAEVGYEYSGEEYWTTFCSGTPNWQDSSYYRDQIRDGFRQFHRKFNGAEPRGPWADTFTIICWPITHAILPKDLQRELAYILYELRGSFSSALLHNSELLGQRSATSHTSQTIGRIEQGRIPRCCGQSRRNRVTTRLKLGNS